MSETPSAMHGADDSADALWSRLRLIEGQPLGDRAEAYTALHEELSRRLGSLEKSAADR